MLDPIDIWDRRSDQNTLHHARLVLDDFLRSRV